jgi:hypothetical protein
VFSLELADVEVEVGTEEEEDAIGLSRRSRKLKIST